MSSSTSWYSNSAVAGSPDELVQPAMCARVLRLSRWWAPRIRTRSGSNSWYSRSATVGSPDLLFSRDMVTRVEGVGVMGAQDPDLFGQQRLEKPQRPARVALLTG